MRFALILLTLLLTVPAPLAQGNGNGQGPPDVAEERGQGQGNGNAKDNSGAGQGGGAAANGNGNAANQTDHGPPPAAIAQEPVEVPVEVPVDGESVTAYPPESAVDAVTDGRAVGLASLLPDLEARGAGEVIDAELLNVRGFLVYAVKALRATGQVTTEYYYAQSGRFIGTTP